MKITDLNSIINNMDASPAAMGGMLQKIRDFRQWLIDEEERRMRVPDKETSERDDDEAVKMPELMAARYHLEEIFPFLKKK